ncbi:hypothetical protein FHX77_001091 [Bifidobacterium commune]|uniref:hypothetical protein n=1 Tax=Bifidobacterium commune TaxID=1505727 RepID=UPI0011782FF3|nr:hypothetical protein [Bifidobacterium commune]MBB2955665.1 hypothetical protein [Bifidobacterium commune]
MGESVTSRRGGRQLQERSWCVRATAELADWVLAGAADEGVRPSVLIRTAVEEYLERRHADIRPTRETKV